MMNKISLVVKSLEDFKETFLNGRENNEITLPLKLLTDPSQVSVGDIIELTLIIDNVDRTLELAGEVKWKRVKEIILPGKRITAGIGVLFDEVSLELLKLHFQELFKELSDVADDMAGGNYIRIRSDIATKYHLEKKTNDFNEKRNQPRLTVTIPVEIFIKDQSKKFSTIDICLDGMCISTDEKFSVGEEVLVVFEDSILGKEFLIRAEVLRNISELNKSAKNYAVALKFIFNDDKQKKELMKFIIRRS